MTFGVANCQTSILASPNLQISVTGPLGCPPRSGNWYKKYGGALKPLYRDAAIVGLKQPTGAQYLMGY
jgi:hypothetical protein